MRFDATSLDSRDALDGEILDDGGDAVHAEPTDADPDRRAQPTAESELDAQPVAEPKDTARRGPSGATKVRAPAAAESKVGAPAAAAGPSEIAARRAEYLSDSLLQAFPSPALPLTVLPS